MTFIVIVFTIIKNLTYKIIEHKTEAHSLETMKASFLHERSFIALHENTSYKQRKRVIKWLLKIHFEIL